MKLGNLALRFATAIVLVPPLVYAVQMERPEPVWGIVIVATAMILHEFFAIALDDPGERRFGLGLGLALAAAAYWWRPAIAFLPAALIVVPGLFYLFRYRDLGTVLARLGATSFGLAYAGLLLTYVAFLKRDLGPSGGDWILVVLMTAFFGDTGGYFAGRAIGGPKLYPAISPGKTWAGSIGGLAGSFGAAVLANLWFFPELGWVHGAIVTIVGGALGQCGDLVESMIKRARGVKDSGSLLPGHGGMLDRIDAVIVIAPWAYLYATTLWR